MDRSKIKSTTDRIYFTGYDDNPTNLVGQGIDSNAFSSKDGEGVVSERPDRIRTGVEGGSVERPSQRVVPGWHDEDARDLAERSAGKSDNRER